MSSFILSKAVSLKKGTNFLKEYGVLLKCLNNRRVLPKSDTYLTLEVILTSKLVANMTTRFGSKFNKLSFWFRNLMGLPEVKMLVKNNFLSISKIWVLPPAKICSLNPFYRTFGKCSLKSTSMKCMQAQENFLIQLPKAI